MTGEEQARGLLGLVRADRARRRAVYQVWTASAESAEALEHKLEVQLNEFAEEVVSVSYAVTDSGGHHVLLVYRGIASGTGLRAAVAAEVAEESLAETGG